MTSKDYLSKITGAQVLTAVYDTMEVDGWNDEVARRVRLMNKPVFLREIDRAFQPVSFIAIGELLYQCILKHAKSETGEENDEREDQQ